MTEPYAMEKMYGSSEEGEVVMDPEIKAEWLRELRSGENRQCVWRLHNKSGAFCCLGVLCDIVYDGDWEWCEDGNSWCVEGKRGLPPVSVLNQASLYEDKVEKLAGMNDQGATFDEIADYIEREL